MMMTINTQFSKMTMSLLLLLLAVASAIPQRGAVIELLRNDRYPETHENGQRVTARVLRYTKDGSSLIIRRKHTITSNDMTDLVLVNDFRKFQVLTLVRRRLSCSPQFVRFTA